MTDSYIALDLETTGLEPKKEKITEIAALKVEHGQITGRFRNSGKSKTAADRKGRGINKASPMTC